jgi:hypothetical protein
VSAVQCEVDPGFVPHMRVPGRFYVNADLEALLFEELRAFASSGGHGGFLPAVKQLANVAALPGIVQARRQQPACSPSTANHPPLLLSHALWMALPRACKRHVDL